MCYNSVVDNMRHCHTKYFLSVANSVYFSNYYLFEMQTIIIASFVNHLIYSTLTVYDQFCK